MSIESFKYYSPIGFLSLFPNVNIIQFDYRECLEKKFNFEKTQLYNDKPNIIIMNNHPASKKQFNMEKITMKYWIDKVKEKL